MIGPDDVGGVHVKYLYHCRRQLWLYARGVRPEYLSAAVQLGEAVHETSYTRHSPIDLGAAKLDHLDGAAWVHEVKSSARPSPGDEAQVIHYCYRLHAVGVPAEGGILRYPKTRRTRRVPYTEQAAAQARADIDEVLAVVAAPNPRRGRLAPPAAVAPTSTTAGTSRCPPRPVPTGSPLRAAFAVRTSRW